MANTTLTDEWGSFTAIPNDFIEQAARLSDQARWLFVLLRFHTNSATKTAFPSYDAIKSQTGWGYNTIAKAVRDLENNGWLTRQKRFSGTTHYTLKKPTNLPETQSLRAARNGHSLRTERTGETIVQSLRDDSTVLASRKPNKTEITKIEIQERESAPVLPSVDRPQEQPFAPNDDVDNTPPEPEWTVGERFLLKACDLWEKPLIENDWRLKQSVKSCGRWVNDRLDLKKQIGGTPALFRKFWFEELSRKANPRPEYVVEQWDAYDRWLIDTHETHRRRLAA